MTTVGSIRKGYVTTSAGQVHFREAGAGLPLVLLHQSPSASTMWEPVLPALAAQSIRGIAFDFPGFGNSDKPATKPDMSWYASIMVEAAQACGLPRFSVLGHHTGATMALVMADEHSDAIEKLLMWGVPMLPAERMLQLANEAPFPYTPEGTEIVNAYVNRGKQSGPHWNADMAVRCLIERLQLGRDSNWAHNAVGNVDHPDVLKRVTTPTLVLCGPKDAIVHQPSKDAAALMPNARYQDVMDASLDVADEYPVELAAVVAEFLRG